MWTFAIALALGLIGYKILSSKAPGGTGLSPTQGESALQVFDTKVAAEILRNTLLYSYEPGIGSGDGAGMEGITLIPNRDEKGRLSFFPSHDRTEAFRWIEMINTAGYAVLAPVSMWTETQPWSTASARMIIVSALDAARISSLTAKGSPWATLIRVPGKLTKFHDMAGQKIAEVLHGNDLI